MVSFLLLTLFCLINFSNADFNTCTSIPSESPLKVVQTLNGQLRGECKIIPVSYSNSSNISSDVFSWLSIPFAEPPINKNRFKRPIPVSNWSNIKNATHLPNSCMQTDMNEANSEDCLYLNVYSRLDVFLNKDTSLQPVLVWIHGGGFTAGSTREPIYEPSTIVAMSGIVVATIQYRLDVFGFIRLEGTDATGNQGLLDQSLALKWVYENVRNFGGDPSKITIQGESAGASSVGYHLLYTGSWPYFKNAIVQSVWQCKFLMRP
jgi:carboxylesterase type B